MFWLIYVSMNIQNVLLWLECRHGDVYATGKCQWLRMTTSNKRIWWWWWSSMTHALFHSNSQKTLTQTARASAFASVMRYVVRNLNFWQSFSPTGGVMEMLTPRHTLLFVFSSSLIRFDTDLNKKLSWCWQQARRV